jgi:hypothetical protein
MTAPDEVEGKRIKCKKCSEAFVAARVDDAEFEEEPPAKPAKSKPPKVPARPAPRDEEEDLPKRKSERPARASSSEDDRPRRRSEEDDDEAPRKFGKREQAESVKPTNVLLALLLGFGGILLSAGLTYGAIHFLGDREQKQPEPATSTGGPPAQPPAGPKAPPKGGVPFPGPKTK